MLEPLQMRAPSKRWLALASVILVSTASLAWSFTRLRRTGQIEGAPALKQKAGGKKQQADYKTSATRDSSESPSCPSCPACPSCPPAALVDSDNDGIPDIEELRT